MTPDKYTSETFKRMLQKQRKHIEKVQKEEIKELSQASSAIH